MAALAAGLALLNLLIGVVSAPRLKPDEAVVAEAVAG